MRRQAGYTVLEALIAFAILSVVLVALYAAAGTSLHAVDRGSQSRRIALLAQSKLDEIAATRDVLPATSRGTFAGTDVTWQTDARDLPNGYAGRSVTMLQDIEIQLSWPGDNGPQSILLETRHLGVLR